MSVDVVRDAAIDVLLRVFERDVRLDDSLDKTLRRREISSRGRRFLTQLVYGTVRHKLLCDHVLEPIVDQSLDKLPRPIHAVLRMGVFQSLFCTQVTFPAMVHTSVDLAKKRGHAGTARLTNAVLRRAPQSLDQVRFPDADSDRPGYLSVRYSLPRWLVEKLIAELGESDAKTFCEASNTEAPVTLRVNTFRTTIEQLMANLRKSGYVVEKQTTVPEEVTLIEGETPTRSKFLLGGQFLIQDTASMIPPHLLEPQAGDTVLDLCAAPGGKTTHIAQLAQGEARAVAMDRSFGKLRRVSENATRLGITGITLVCGDGTSAPFAPGCADRVLVDAPCTGLGTLRRHPDMKWRVRDEDFARLSEVQQGLLRSGVRLCKNGGLIVYSVCTVSRAETEQVVRAIIADRSLEPEDGPAWLAPWKIDKGQYRILPRTGGLDGFYLTRLRKVS